MSSIKFSEKILIHKDPECVFDYTQDYGKRLSWDTFLIKAELINGATEAGIGVKAWCVAHNGLGMETEYVSYNRPKATAIKMTRGPYMFKAFAGSWNFRQVATGQTEVTFLYSYQLRFPFNLVMPLIKNNLRKNVSMRLRDLKKCIEV